MEVCERAGRARGCRRLLGSIVRCRGRTLCSGHGTKLGLCSRRVGGTESLGTGRDVVN